MSSDIAIQIENLGKMYRLGEVGTGTISHDLNRWFARVRGKEDPFAKIGETNDRTAKGISAYVWALKDVNFEIKKGQAVGIIGRNGAGKSTLLKLLSKVTKPTTGTIKINGRIASLLEVGTGFHPEMTGRENIFLNGAIMGMTKKEIKGKFDEIVDFAGVERYVDTPVKRYSSGMYVRLAFAVAAHLEPEILIVDEVLAVGDAEFQKKCLGKMKDVSTNEGRTVLFVSHNMAAISSLCQSAIQMQNGSVLSSGPTDDVIRKYIDVNNNGFISNRVLFEGKIFNGIEILNISIVDEQGNDMTFITTDDFFQFKISYRVIIDASPISFTLGVWNSYDEIIFLSINNSDKLYSKPLPTGVYESYCQIPKCFLNNNSYSFSLNISSANFQNPILIKDVIKINVNDGLLVRKDYLGGYPGYLRPDLQWNTKRTL